MTRPFKLALLAIFFALTLFSNYAQNIPLMLSQAGLTENTKVRGDHYKLMVEGQENDFLVPSEIFQNSFGDDVQLDIQIFADGIYFIYINRGPTGFDIDSAGTWAIKRSVTTGKIIQAKIFLLNDKDSYLLIRPREQQSDAFSNNAQVYLDFYLQGLPYRLNLILPISIENLIKKDIAYIIRLSSTSIDWPTVFPNTQASNHAKAIAFKNEIESQLPLQHPSKTVMDEQGNWVPFSRYIDDTLPINYKSLAQSKWIIDQLYASLAKADESPYTLLLPLFQPQESVYDENSLWLTQRQRFPLIGLEWTRNLSNMLAQKEQLSDALTYNANDLILTPPLNYNLNLGYSLEEIKVVLYMGMIANPDNFFLGAVNFIGNRLPQMRHFYDVAVFVPYIDENKAFQVTVFTNGRSQTLESYLAPYKSDDFDYLPGVFIHLSRVHFPYIIDINN